GGFNQACSEPAGFWVERTGGKGGTAYRNRRKPLRLRGSRIDQGDPDLDLCRAWFLEAGLDPHDAEVVLRDYYPPDQVTAGLRADSFPTLKLMDRVGVLDHPTARPAFVEQKLID